MARMSTRPSVIRNRFRVAIFSGPVVSPLVGDLGDSTMTDRFRKRMRLASWNYANSAVYMVTVCIADRTHRLGTMTETNEVDLADAGRMVTQEILAIPGQFANVELDEFVVMPNHVHLLIGIRSYDGNRHPTSLASVVGAFKSRTTNRYIRGVKMGLLPAFDRHLWQTDYYETIMRNEQWVEQRGEYIVNNPANWREDPEME